MKDQLPHITTTGGVAKQNEGKMLSYEEKGQKQGGHMLHQIRMRSGCVHAYSDGHATGFV